MCLAGSLLQSGSLATTDASVSVMSFRRNARTPVSISHSTHPNAQMSLRLSTAFPRACSGPAYGAVPRMAPPIVGSSASESLRGAPDPSDQRPSTSAAAELRESEIQHTSPRRRRAL